MSAKRFSVKYRNVNINPKDRIMQLSDGTVLDEMTCSDICLGFERMCTANLLRESYGIRGIQRSFDLADEVREQMDDYGFTETEAIDEVLGR